MKVAQMEKTLKDSGTKWLMILCSPERIKTCPSPLPEGEGMNDEKRQLEPSHDFYSRPFRKRTKVRVSDFQRISRRSIFFFAKRATYKSLPERGEKENTS